MTSGQTKKIVYFGNERLISGLDKTDAPILQGLIARGYDVVAVVSHHSLSNSRNQRELEVAEIAKEHGIPVLLPARPSDIIDELRTFGADVAVLAAYGRIISQQVIDLFPLGIVNIHPSLLPQYRGPTPIESSILGGDTQTGVSIMQLSAGMDEGPVYAQRSLAVADTVKKFDLYAQIVGLSTALFFDVFPSILDGSLQPTPQNGSDATYSQLIQKSDGTIDWNKGAQRIEREIRAYQGWPQSRTTLGKVEVIVTAATVVQRESNLAPGELKLNETATSLLVGTSNGDIQIDAIKPLGKKEMPIQAFLAGYKSQIL